ncbi:MAG TPA: DUF1828 domain-containing protein [Candidatus Binataceae bacterium]|nr:DUF1828 domain-containing protein [Candidatus Binataceae bacterium]
MPTDRDNIQKELKRKICEDVQIVEQGLNRYVVVTPFTFDDGDVVPVVLQKRGDNWSFTDEGHTFMQLTYELDEADLEQPTRRDIIERTLSTTGVQNRSGELVLPVPDERFGDALYTFLQAILKIDDVRYLSRERAKTTFFDDFRALVKKVVAVPPDHLDRVVYDWYEPSLDPTGNYRVDCRVNGTEMPLLMFALNSEDRVQKATITLLRFSNWHLRFKSVGIFEEQEKINARALARFTDACGKAFSSLAAANEGLPRFFPELTTV